MKLYTNRTSILPLSEKDFENILKMYKEPDSSKFISPLQGKDEAFLKTFLEGKIASNKTEVGFWVVREKETNVFLGTGNLNEFSLRPVPHVGCHLSRKIWGNGYGYEIMNRLKHYGIEERKLDAIHGFVEEGNAASKALMVKMGFKLIEQMDAGVLLNNYRFSEKPMKS